MLSSVLASPRMGSACMPPAVTYRCFNAAAAASPGPRTLRRGEVSLVAQRKLNFGDVLIVPQKSFIHSRSKVDIHTSYKFKYSPHLWNGIPLMSSNMDTVTNVTTAEILAHQEWISVFPKHFNKEWDGSEAEQVLPEVLAKTNNYSLSCGTSDADISLVLQTAKQIERAFGNPVKMVTVDIANGYLDNLV